MLPKDLSSYDLGLLGLCNICNAMRENGISVVRSTVFCKESYESLRRRESVGKHQSGVLVEHTEKEAIMEGINKNLLRNLIAEGALNMHYKK